MLRIDSIDTTENEFIDGRGHVVLQLHHAFALSIRRVRFSSSQNGIEGATAKLFGRAENAGIGKVHHGVKLEQIVLHGRASQQDAALDGQGVKSATGLIVAVFESMGLVANEQVATISVLGQTAHVGAQTFVTGNEDVEHFGFHKHVNILFHRLAIRFGQSQRLDCTGTEPLDEPSV